MSNPEEPAAGRSAISLLSEEKLAFAARFSSDLFVYINSEGQVEMHNSAFERELGAGDGDVEGKSIMELFPKKEFAEVFKLHFAECLQGNQTYTEYHHTGDRGIDKQFGIQFVPYFVGDSVTSALVLFRDISYIRRLEDKVQLLEYHDRRTGLPNRRSLDLALDKEIAKNRRRGPEARMAVLFISLENFARINQTYGHEIGDILIENSGLRIKESLISELLRDSDYVFEAPGEAPSDIAEEIEPVEAGGPAGDEAPSGSLFRFEGKEFAAILTEISRETDAALVASRIAKNVSQPYYDKFGSEIFINCNIGIAVYPNDGEERVLLVQHAMSAMHEAKRREIEFLLFNPELQEKSLEKIRLGGNIYNAFIESQFELYYQPVVDYLGEIVGAEALIRWNHPEKGMIPPSEFLPLAEEKGIIVNIGKWALYTVLRQLERWPKDIYVTVNMSARELSDPQAVDTILKALNAASGIAPHQLKIEISESVWTKDPEKFISKMRRLVSKGIDIQVDNYGTGRSSLRSLKDLPARTLKIDSAFLTDICNDTEEFKFLESIVALAYNRKKTVVIEGVENRDQAEMIRRMKPVYMQGYYFSGPVPAHLFERLINRRVKLPVSE
ncbi:MAG: EAL domain-containing protein [Spirochaetales bacterium]|nr:EAL domain-containing protein [Spirochaetales bacterium]